MARSAGKSWRFTSIQLRNWRNFLAVNVSLQARVVLIGPNASGKSNFLDVFRFLRDLCVSGGGLQEAVARRGALKRLRCLSARKHPEVFLRATIGDDTSRCRWEYELALNHDSKSRPVIRREVVVRDGDALVQRPDADDNRDPERLTQTCLEQVQANKEFRELVTFFQGIQYLHVVPQLVRDPERSLGRAGDPYGGDFLEQIARTPDRTRERRLRQIAEALKCAVPQLDEIQLERDARGTPHLRGRYQHWRPAGAWQSEADFSDGTLRLMGLLWATLAQPGPLLLEEPELSLHPGVVRNLPEMFARMQRRTGRQVMLSTHSAQMLESEGLGLDEVLLLAPGAEGTTVQPVTELVEVREQLNAGLSLADVLVPLAKPPQAEQLMLFGD